MCESARQQAATEARQAAPSSAAAGAQDRAVSRGYFGVAVWHPKTGVNIGTLWRSAAILDAAFVATIGKRYPPQASDTIKTPRHTPLWHFASVLDFWEHIPYDCRPVAVEITARSKPLHRFVHPERAVYILGPEDGTLPEDITKRAHAVVQIPGAYCFNLAVAGSIVLYDRTAKALGAAPLAQPNVSA